MSPRPTLRAELRQLLRLGTPLALTQMGQALLGVVDVAVLGRAGPTLLGGVGLGNALYFGIAVLGMGVMLGLDPLVSQAVGAGERGKARRLAWQGVWLSLALTAVLAIPILLAPRALAPFGVAPELCRQAGTFLSWRLLGLPFLLCYFAPRSFLQAQNRVAPMVIAVAIANVVNLGLDLVLVFGGAGLPAWTGPLRSLPALGVVGSALASNVASALQLAVLALAVRAELGAERSPDAPRGSAFLPDPRALALAVRVGVPTGLHMCAEVNFFSAFGSTLAGRLGTLSLAAHQVALQLGSLTFSAVTGLGTGGSVRVGLAVGARDREGARRAGIAALLGATGLMSATALVFVAFPGPVARLMTDDPGVVAISVPLLRVAGAFQLFDGLQGVGSAILRGAGDTRYTFAVNMVAYWAIGLPVVLLLSSGLGLGVLGLWIGFVVSLAVIAGRLVPRFLRLSAREIAPLVDGRREGVGAGGDAG